MRELKSSLADSLTNQSPSPEQIRAIELFREAADQFCQVLDDITVPSREQSLAKTHLEETVMWGVKSIVLPRD